MRFREIRMTITCSCTMILGCLLAPPALAQGEHMHARAECLGSAIEVSWTYYYDPGGYPEFVGYDVYRQSLTDCEDPIRMNEDPFPRSPGQTHSHAFMDSMIALETMYRYKVELVDENRQRVFMPNCDPCVQDAWASCPELSAPLAHGTLLDFGPVFLWLVPCPDSCFGIPCGGGFCWWLIEEWPPELNQYVGTGIAVRLYGPYACGGVEGCGMSVDHFEIAPCGATPADPASWGSIKATYR